MGGDGGPAGNIIVTRQARVEVGPIPGTPLCPANTALLIRKSPADPDTAGAARYVGAFRGFRGSTSSAAGRPGTAPGTIPP